MNVSDDTTSTTVTVKPAWVNTWFHALFTEPGLEIDGKNHELRWGTNTVPIPHSASRIGFYFRYRGRSAQRLALSEKSLDHPVARRIEARLGVRNSALFSIVESKSR